MSSEPHVWALTDDRAGNVSQVIGVADSLGWPYELKHIRYTPYIRLPNLLLGSSLLGICQKTSDSLAPPWPDIVIAAGRRSASAALYIRKKNPKTFLVHMMSPDTRPNEFDIIALPSHDTVAGASNLVRTLGAPHLVTEERLKQARDYWAGTFGGLKHPKTALLIGGNTSHGKWREEEINTLLRHTRSLADKGSLMVTTSRRTPSHIVPRIHDMLAGMSHYLYVYDEQHKETPYLGMLAHADRIVVTGESISMCSEACFTGKPVFVYSPTHAMSDKHKRFVELLIGQGFAWPLEDPRPDWQPVNILNEAGRLATVIRERYQ